MVVILVLNLVKEVMEADGTAESQLHKTGDKKVVVKVELAFAGRACNVPFR